MKRAKFNAYGINSNKMNTMWEGSRSGYHGKEALSPGNITKTPLMLETSVCTVLFFSPTMQTRETTFKVFSSFSSTTVNENLTAVK